MRFSALFVSATLASLSVAQSTAAGNSTSASASLVPSSTYTLTPAQSSQASCLSACAANDPNCRAKCIVVNEGDYSQQNRTIDCISECPKGNGTEIDNLNFENCQKGCVKSATITPASTMAISTATQASSGASGTGASDSSETGSSDSNSSGGSSTSGSSSTPSGSAASSTSSGSAADNVHIPIIGAFIGLGALAVMFGL